MPNAGDRHTPNDNPNIYQPGARGGSAPNRGVREADAPSRGTYGRNSDTRWTNPRGSAPAYTNRPGSTGRVYRNPSGTEAHMGSNGRVESVHARGMTINHSPGGWMEVYRPDRTVIVTNRSGHGYVQRPFAYRGHEYVHRTYYVHGVAYARYYRPYTYHGVVVYGYVPVRYYSPAFYDWVYNPWARPVYYQWGWGGNPWYGYYGGYFEPAPYYPTPALWLADYLISQRLMEAYQEQANAAAAMQAQSLAATQMSPQVKQAIAEEVQRQLAIENQEGQRAARNEMDDPGTSGIGALLSDNKPHAFVVSYNLDVNDDAGHTCTVSRGDVLELRQPPPMDATAAWVQVVASKGPSCPRGTTVAVQITDLQDMNNQMRETLAQGMNELHSRAGQGGLPAMPRSAMGEPVAAPFAQSAPPPDANVATELTQQVQEADRVEQEVLSEARKSDPNLPSSGVADEGPPAGSQPGSAQTSTISIGQTQDQVVAIMGNPLQIIKLGTKEIYRYRDMKITFVSGRVTDAQ